MSEAGSISEWEERMGREAVSFSFELGSVEAAVDRVMAEMAGVEVLGFGEALHGGEEFLLMRNRIFARLAEKHGFTAIAVESSFPRGRMVDYFVGNGVGNWESVKESGFSHGFGKLEANRELALWMRGWNETHAVKVRFGGFDGPMEMMTAESPRRILRVVMDYLAEVDGAQKWREVRERVEGLLGEDSAWENPTAMMDPGKSVGATEQAKALRLEVEGLIVGLELCRPELEEGWGRENGGGKFVEALHFAKLGRGLLTYHAGVAGRSPRRTAELLGMRDLMMAENVRYILQRERRHGGRLLVFAHNSHLKKGRAAWQLGPELLEWWPAGAHLAGMLGDKYRVIGTGLGVSEANGIAPPAEGSLEWRLMEVAGPGRFVPTGSGRGLQAATIAELPARGAGWKNYSYFPLTAQSFGDFDWWAVLDSVSCARGGPAMG